MNVKIGLRPRQNDCIYTASITFNLLQYDFAAAFDQILNAVKWIKQLHGIQRKPFTLESPLPSDLNIVIKEALLCMNDDPFENRLQLIYETSMDEVFERERRFQMLEQKTEQLKKDYGGGISSKFESWRYRESLEHSRALNPIFKI